MKSIEQLLKEDADRAADEYQRDDKREKIGPANSFKAGAAHRDVLILELVEALEKAAERKSPCITAWTVYSYEAMADECKEALQNFRRGLGE